MQVFHCGIEPYLPSPPQDIKQSFGHVIVMALKQEPTDFTAPIPPDCHFTKLYSPIPDAIGETHLIHRQNVSPHVWN